MSLEFSALIFLFFLIAFIYSIAGFGGGSSYLAILALFSFDQEIIRSTALICNIAVVSSGSYLYFNKGLLKLKTIFPIIFLSVPMAYLGGRIQLSQSAFFIVLGITLLVAALAMILPIQKKERKLIAFSNQKSNAIIGGAIGFLSGVVGIGGGIFLSPVLHLTHWSNAKIIAATCSFFILVNSIAGLIGQMSIGGFAIEWKFVTALAISVFVGGQMGNRLSTSKLKSDAIRKIAAILILIVAVRILLATIK